MNEYDRIAKERIQAEKQANVDQEASAKRVEESKAKQLADFSKHFTSVVANDLKNHLNQHPLKGGVEPKLIPYVFPSIPKDAMQMIEGTLHFEISYGPWKVTPQELQSDVAKYSFQCHTARPFQVHGPGLTPPLGFPTLHEAMSEAYYRQEKSNEEALNKFKNG